VVARRGGEYHAALWRPTHGKRGARKCAAMEQEDAIGLMAWQGRPAHIGGTGDDSSKWADW
jgi:hypothetical protein